MSTDFFCKIIKRIVALCACIVFVLSGVYAVRLSKGEYLSLGTECYFLCVEEGGAEACATQVALEGGAGYVWCDKVVLAAYFTDQEVFSVAEKVKDKYPSVAIEKLSPKEILVSAAKKEEMSAKLNNLYAHMRAVSDVATDLENGLTQEKAKSRLRSLCDGFSSLAKLYPQESVQSFCGIAKSRIESSVAGIVYASELRHCVCELAVAFYQVVKGESL